ncbi:6927_t:CDS:2 [Ambispora gerdemannii]|uniref:6927_t:CDS:1 n=1 Tax=Ambispora gerdemannii TaxID=144530 RepID=A0A9N9GIM9_9GLOM|nr:6927_t:CDS:2 [Ambispora gerdemannii]
MRAEAETSSSTRVRARIPIREPREYRFVPVVKNPVIAESKRKPKYTGVYKRLNRTMTALSRNKS